MHRPIPTPAIASCFSLCGFAVALLSGMRTGNDTATILQSAIVALVVCYAVGYFVARAGRWIVIEHLALQRVSDPIPEVSTGYPVVMSAEPEEGDGPVETVRPGASA